MSRNQVKYIDKFLVKILIILSIFLANGTCVHAKAVTLPADFESKYGKWLNLPTDLLVEKGRTFLYQQQCPDSALACFSIATSRYSESLSKEEKQEIYRAFIGKWYAQFFHYYDYPKAYESLSEALKISDETGSGKGMANLNLGMMYQMFGTDGRDRSALNTAKSYNRKAFREAIAEKDTNVVHMAFSNMVSLLSEKKEIAEIQPYRDEYERFNGKSNHPVGAFNLLFYDINRAIANGDYDKALTLLDCQSQFVTSAQPRYLISILMSRANVYRLKKEYDNAEKILKEAEEIAARENMKDVLLNVYDELKTLFHDSGDARKEAEAYYSLLCMKDSLLNYRQISGFTEIGFLSEMEKLDRTLTEMQYKRKAQAWIVAFCVVIIIGLICFVMVVLRKNRKLSAANMSLYEKTKQLIEQEDLSPSPHHIKEKEPRNDADSGQPMTPEEREKQEAIMKQIYLLAANSEEIYSPKFTISKMAELADLPVKQISKAINEETGENFNGFINRYRIKKACLMLDDVDKYGKLTIENIGLNVGFRSRTAFITAFKKLTGLNPSDYLKAARQAKLKKEA